MTTQPWASDIFAVFKTQRIALVSYVPDAGHSELIKLCEADANIKTAPLTTEEEGIALAAGAYLGGVRAALLLQSSGVGNCINMLSLVASCGFPLLMLVTMRGEWGEFNPWQVPMGQATPKVLEQSGLIVYRVNAAAEVSATIEAAAKIAFNSQVGAAVLLSQKLIGVKSFGR
jgi:sulfopyruvate decarboxylase alpha subunit